MPHQGEKSIHVSPDMDDIKKQWAEYYASSGLVPIPVKPQSKQPDLGNNWQNQIDVKANIELITPEHNIGINLGASGDLTDIDLDCKEAWELAPHLLLVTNAVFGRKSALKSHWLYLCAGIESKNYIDPVAINTKSMILEIRSSGQTVFPPSTHEGTHEQIEWEIPPDFGNLTTINKEELEAHVGRLASAALLARHLKLGCFHDATVALAGGLLRIWSEEYTTYFIEVVGRAAGMQDIEDRKRIVRDTARKLKKDEQNVSGWPKLKVYIPSEVVDKIMEWLNVSTLKAQKIFGKAVLSNGSNIPNSHDVLSTNNKIKISSWGELSIKKIPRMEWIINSFLPPGASLIAARPKQGKSFLVHAMLLLVTAGRPVFGYASLKCDVMYMTLEDSERRLQGRTRKLMATHGLSDADIRGFHYTLSIPRLGEGLEEQLITLLNENKAVRFVVIDVLAKIRKGRNNKQSVYEYDYDVGERLKQICNSHPDVAFLIVHHNNKGMGDALDAISGSHGLAGGFDNTYGIFNGDSGLELHINGRDIEDSTPIPLIKGENGMWTFESRNSAINIRNSDTRNAILDAIDKGNSTPKDISNFTEIDANTINSSLYRMVHQTLLIKKSRGNYARPPVIEMNIQG